MKETNYKELSEKLEQEVWDLQDEIEFQEGCNLDLQIELDEANDEIKSLNNDKFELINEIKRMNARMTKLELENLQFSIYKSKEKEQIDDLKYANKLLKDSMFKLMALCNKNGINWQDELEDDYEE